MQLAEEFPTTFVRSSTGLQRLRNALFKPKSRDDIAVTVIYGATGVGKSRFLARIASVVDTYWKPNGKWWEQYNGESFVFLDDFRATDMDFNTLLRVTDRYPMIVDIKCSSAQLKASDIFITSCYKPEDWYGLQEDNAQLLRRIHYIIELKGEGDLTFHKGKPEDFNARYEKYVPVDAD